MLHVCQVVRGEEDRRATIAKPADQLASGRSRSGVQACRGLVEEQHLGSADEGDGQGQSLFLAARQLPVARVGHQLQPDQLDEAADVARRSMETGEQPEHLARRSLRIDAASALEHQPDARLQRRASGRR